MGAGGVDRQHLVPDACQQHGLLAHVAAQQRPPAEIGQRDALRQVRAVVLVFL